MTLLRELISRNKILQTELNQLNNDALDLDISGISSNSKSIKEGYIFIAIKGFQFDGYKFIQEARKNGAILIIAEEINEKNVVSIKKGSSREIYALLAAS
jgi:UDP-N-acetylmuramoyl-L-alanyl-D-glutamate--2,6-diaminopimelate ligase